MTTLVEILLQAQLVSKTQADDAYNLQVLYGDRIGTNLLVSGAVRESALARALGALHGVPYAAGKDADTRPQFTRGIHRNVALAHRAVPARVDEQHALVFMTDPHDRNARAQLERDLGRPVSPVVVCEARMSWLLYKFYLAPKPRRLVGLDGLDRTPRQRIRARSETRPDSLYHGNSVVAVGAIDDETTIPRGRPAPPSHASHASHASQASQASNASQQSVWPSFLGPPPSIASATAEGSAFDDPTTPQALPPSRTQSQGSRWPSFLGPEPVPAHFEPSVEEELLVELAPVDEAPVITGVLVEPPRDTSPLTFNDAKKLLATAKDRNEIALIVLRSCLSSFKRAVLLTVHHDVAIGWDGVGDGIDLQTVKEIRLPLKAPSIFQLARDSKAHFLGPLPKEKVNILFLKLAGAQIPKSALVVPVVVRNTVLNLLYCDNGKGQQVTTDIGDMLVVAQHINRSYEQLLRR